MELKITSSGPPNDSRNLRLEVDGKRAQWVRGFKLAAHVADEDLNYAPALILSVFHFACSEDVEGEQPRVCGTATLSIEVPVWVEWIRSPHPDEPIQRVREEPGPEEMYTNLWEALRSRADRNPQIAALLDALEPPVHFK
jgi:hypothetical protein